MFHVYLNCQQLTQTANCQHLADYIHKCSQTYVKPGKTARRSKGEQFVGIELGN